MASGGNARKHSVIFLKRCVILKDKKKQEKLNKEIEDMVTTNSDNFNWYLTFRKKIPKGQDAILKKWNLTTLEKKGLQAFIEDQEDKDQVVIICGSVDKGMKVASITKSFLIAAGWVGPKPSDKEHVILAPTPSKMTALLQIVANQTSWYYSCTFDKPVPTKVVSLFPANTYVVNADEKFMAESLRNILKYNGQNRAIKQALICHLMTAIAHDPEFKEVQDWAVAPSSSKNPPQIMEELKEHVRCMMYGRKPAAMFLRHKATTKSHFDKSDLRKHDDYCQKHFESILVSKEYRKKLKDRVVCVFDDYLTYGNTFEALRNLLVKCKVKKIIFVSIGKYRVPHEKKYRQKLYSIGGNVSKMNYKADLKSTVDHPFCIHDHAKQSLRHLKELVNNLE